MTVTCYADHLANPATTTLTALLKSIKQNINKETAEQVKAELKKYGTAKYYAGESKVKVIIN
jgi:uncharacterized protein (DUF2267 family)